MEKYIFYKRKSDDSEDRQILSISSQDRVVRESVTGFSGLSVICNYEESQSAKRPGRPKFNEMCERLERGEAKYIICWQLNRLARNPPDGGRIIWLVQNYGIKIITPSKTYDSNDILLMWVEFAMSNQFIIDLRKNTMRGLGDKLNSGIAPILAPIGYYNDTTKKQGLRDILCDEQRFPLVRKMWDLLLTGNYAPPRILNIATNEWGLRQRNGRPLSRSKIYEIFRNIFYTGKFYLYSGKLHDNGVHKSMITIEEYEKAQKILGRRGTFKFRLSEHTFAFNNSIISCTCGSSITAHERYRKVCPQCHLKYNSVVNEKCPKCGALAPTKTSYFCYYHCSRKKDPDCKQPAATPKDLNEQFDQIISLLTLPEEFIDWALAKLRKAHSEEIKYRNTINISVQANFNTATKKLDNLLSKYLSEVNKNGELISDEEYKRQKVLLLDEKKKAEEILKGYSNQQDNWLNTAEKSFNFVLTAREKYKNGTKEEKREIVTSFGLNLILDNKILRLDLKKPFGKIQEASKRLQNPSDKIEPTKRIVREGQTYYFDSANPLWGDRRELNPQHSPPQ